MLQLGSKGKLLKVLCDDASARPRYFYVKLDEEDCQKIRQLEHHELDKITFAGDRASNVVGTTCNLRFPHGTEPWLSLQGCKVTVDVDIGRFRRGRRGYVLVDLLASKVQLVRRPWYWPCV